MASPDYTGTLEGAFLPGGDPGHYNVLATFSSQAAVGRAITALRNEGFSDADMHLMGSAEDAVVGNVGLTEHDIKVVGSSMRWSVIGAVAGAAIGAVIGIVVMAVPAFQSAMGIHASAASYGLAALFGALIGSILGFAGGILGLDRNRAGVSSYDEQRPSTAALVGVHVEGDARTTAATAALHSAGAVSVERTGRSRKIVIPPPQG